MSQIIRPQAVSSAAQEGPILPARPCLPPRPKPMEPKVEQKVSPPGPMQQPIQPTPADTYQASSAIYEEIKDDIVRDCTKLEILIN